MGDGFNVVRNMLETRGRDNSCMEAEMEDFNSFIDELEVVDIPVVGNMFTWYNSDCRPKSGLDRFLGSEGIISRWKILGQVTGLRDISDHKPIWIK